MFIAFQELLSKKQENLYSITCLLLLPLLSNGTWQRHFAPLMLTDDLRSPPHLASEWTVGDPGGPRAASSPSLRNTESTKRVSLCCVSDGSVCQRWGRSVSLRQETKKELGWSHYSLTFHVNLNSPSDLLLKLENVDQDARFWLPASNQNLN